MWEFFKRHWVLYLIGAVLAAVLGYGLSYYIGHVWTN